MYKHYTSIINQKLQATILPVSSTFSNHSSIMQLCPVSPPACNRCNLFARSVTLSVICVLYVMHSRVCKYKRRKGIMIIMGFLCKAQHCTGGTKYMASSPQLDLDQWEEYIYIYIYIYINCYYQREDTKHTTALSGVLIEPLSQENRFHVAWKPALTPGSSLVRRWRHHQCVCVLSTINEPQYI